MQNKRNVPLPSNAGSSWCFKYVVCSKVFRTTNLSLIRYFFHMFAFVFSFPFLFLFQLLILFLLLSFSFFLFFSFFSLFALFLKAYLVTVTCPVWPCLCARAMACCSIASASPFDFPMRGSTISLTPYLSPHSLSPSSSSLTRPLTNQYLRV